MSKAVWQHRALSEPSVTTTARVVISRATCLNPRFYRTSPVPLPPFLGSFRCADDCCIVYEILRFTRGFALRK